MRILVKYKMTVPAVVSPEKEIILTVEEDSTPDEIISCGLDRLQGSEIFKSYNGGYTECIIGDWYIFSKHGDCHKISLEQIA